MGEIKAIETEYDGYRFRSRLEAKWAVFFNAAGIEYRYEAEGFEVDGVRYLPDFYLPGFDVFAEVKGTDAKLFESSSKIGRCIDFDSTPISKGLILLGDIPYYSYPDYPAHCMLYWDEGVCVKLVRFKMRRRGFPTELKTVSGCFGCSTAEIPREATVVPTILDESCYGDKDAGIEAEAYHRARKAHFEFGERP